MRSPFWTPDVVVERELPTDEARALLSLAREIAADELTPKVAEHESAGRFPRDVFRTLGKAGLLGLAYPEEYGGGGQPYSVYLQVLEELAASWAAVALGISVHTLTCFPVSAFGTDAQKQRFLPEMLGGELLGAYCLSEAAAGSDAAALSMPARKDGDAYVLDGTKAWVTHGGVADFYNVFCRTSDEGARGISLLLVDADTPGVVAQPPEKKMGLRSSPTAPMTFTDARVDADRLVGGEGGGFRAAMAALDGGRLGISACAIGVAQAALDVAVAYARERKQFGQPIIDFQGISFMLADMATKVEAGRALYLSAARRRDAGAPYSRQASMAKLFCTDAAMSVATDAVQVLGGYGYIQEYPVERMMRDAKITQIYEGTNQIQRLVIAREMLKENRAFLLAGIG
jgi:alkylation response protein AidB-like acyl-CoA dehydrogenase